MGFSETDWNNLLPDYLSKTEKGRLKAALEQFKVEHKGNDISYDMFYAKYKFPYFLQADIITEVRFGEWDASTASYQKGYIDAIIVSNSCDISSENIRSANVKQCLFAPVFLLENYVKKLHLGGLMIEKISNLTKEIKAQLISNIFYLPSMPDDGREYIVFLDQIFWFPVNELEHYTKNIETERRISLNQYGFYLFILKLSYHLCRLPEQADRPCDNVGILYTLPKLL